MITDYIFSILAIAGIAVLWRSLLADHASIKEWLIRHVPLLKPSLACGTCFTYWLTLLFVLIFDPLHGWLPPLRFALPSPLDWLFSLGLSWMAVSMGALVIRFIYALIEEHVWYAVHILRGSHHH